METLATTRLYVRQRFTKYTVLVIQRERKEPAMAQDKLSIEIILKEVDELAMTGREPEIFTPVGERDTVVGNLRTTRG